MRRILSALIIILVCNIAIAQFYYKGQEPGSTVWYEFTTRDSIKMIFPEFADSTSIIFSNFLSSAYSIIPKTISRHKRFVPAPVVVHPNSMLSNGFVSWAPKRMEVVTLPDWDSDPEHRLKTLAAHETCHVFQVEGLKKGIIKPLTYFFGELVNGAAVGFLPLWYIEGEAVHTETMLTNGGRGRDASFFQYYRTHLKYNAGSKYSYDKWLLSSYKDYIPNHYQFGYQMVGYASSRFGDSLWSSIQRYIARNPYTIFPFYFGLKKYTGLSRKKLYEEAFNHVDSIWSIKQNDEVNNYNELINNDNNYCEYLYPVLHNDSTLISLKKGLSKIPAIIDRDLKTGKEKVIHRPGILLGKMNYSEGMLIWSEYKADPRWEYLNWGELWVINVNKNETKKITRNTKYINPTLTKNGQILVIEHDPKGFSSIVLLDINGKPLGKYQLSSEVEPKEIASGDKGDFYIRASTPNGTKLIYFSDIYSNPNVIFGPIYRHISNITFGNKCLYFIMSENNKNEVYAVYHETGIISKITNSSYGVSNVSYVSDNVLILSLFKNNGIYPSLTKFSNEFQSQINLEEKGKPLYESESFGNIVENADINTYEPVVLKKHRGISNLFNLHSWAPLYFNPNDFINGIIETKPGVTLLSQNLTSTAETTLGYSYGETHGFHGNFNWMKWYPIISLGLDIGDSFPIVYGGDSSGVSLKTRTRIEGNVTVSVPLLLTSGEFFTRLSPGVRYSYNNNWIWNRDIQQYSKKIESTSLFLSFYSLRRLAHRDIRSSLGMYFFSSLSMYPSSKNLIGPTIYSRARLYLPGIASNHSFLISIQHEKHYLKNYFNPNRASLLRGVNTNYLYGWIGTASIDYTFPVYYPDLHLGSLVYFKRMFMNFFSDNTIINQYVKNDQNTYDINLNKWGSTGIEVFTDCHFFRTRYEFNLGYRMGYAYTQEKVFHSFLFSLNMNSIYGFLPNNHFFEYNF